ncbi:MAG: hypothetical protein ACR2L1_04895 [Pyrinomonadaceae bacterium]
MKGLVSADRFQISKSLDRNTAERLCDKANLKVIQLFDYKPDEETLENLNQILFRARKDLTLRVYHHLNLWSDVSFINHLPELERFDWDSNSFDSFKPLYKLKNLVHLGLGDWGQRKHKTSLSFLKDFNKTLESINLQGDYKDLINTLPNLKQLKNVRFISTKLSNFDFLKNLPIKTFGNYGSRVESFEYLKNLTGLKKIRIKTNTKIESIDFIEDLYNLEEIELLYLSKITKIPELSQVKKLRKFFIFECNRIEDIEELKHLKDCSVYVSGKMIKGTYYKNENFNW